MTEPKIKLLDEKRDEALLREAWAFQDSAPKWFQQSQVSEKETLEDFLQPQDGVLLYGIFVEGCITAIIRLNAVATGGYSIDLFAKRKTDLSVLIQAGLSLQAWLFDHGVKGGFGWIPRRNRGVRKIYEALNFTHEGIVCYKGQMHNRPVEWMLMIGFNPEIF